MKPGIIPRLSSTITTQSPDTRFLNRFCAQENAKNGVRKKCFSTLVLIKKE